MEKTKVQCQTPKNTYAFDYPQVVEACEKQMEIFWLPTEPDVEKDLHCIKTELTPAESHGMLATLKLFTRYEAVAGNEYWGGRFKEMFPRPDFQMMASLFSAVELAVHARFYSRIDELLGLNTDEFYESFTNDPILKARMDFLGRCINSKEDLYSVGTFSMVEGAILYSSFAFLKHFQSEGKNKLINLDAGISFSVKDENLHSEAGAWCFRNLLSEERAQGNYLKGSEEWAKLEANLVSAAEQIYEHECRISAMVFSEGKIDGITEKQMNHFVESRLDLCLENLGLAKIYKPTYNPIGTWFYKSIGGDQQHDFFAKVGSSYNRGWKENRFSWGEV